MVWILMAAFSLLSACTDDSRHRRSYVISEAPQDAEVQDHSPLGSKL